MLRAARTRSSKDLGRESSTPTHAPEMVWDLASRRRGTSAVKPSTGMMGRRWKVHASGKCRAKAKAESVGQEGRTPSRSGTPPEPESGGYTSSKCVTPMQPAVCPIWSPRAQQLELRAPHATNIRRDA